MRFNIIAKIAQIKKIYQYPLLRKKNQHIINAAKNFLKKEINLIVESNPEIFINKNLIEEAKFKYKIDKNQS